MPVLNICVLSIVSFLVLLLLSRLMGNRQICQLSMFDYVSSISIGSIAAELATQLDSDWWQPLLAMVLYALLTILLALACRKSLRLRRLLNGAPVVLYQDGELYKAALRRARIDLNDLLSQMRCQGYFDLSELQAVVQEPSGQLSFLPRVEQRPVKVEDLNLHPEKEGLVINLVLDGRVLEQNLRSIRRDRRWLQGQLAAKGFSDPCQLLLVTWDCCGTLTVYPAGERTVNPELLL